MKAGFVAARIVVRYQPQIAANMTLKHEHMTAPRRRPARRWCSTREAEPVCGQPQIPPRRAKDADGRATTTKCPSGTSVRVWDDLRGIFGNLTHGPRSALYRWLGGLVRASPMIAHNDGLFCARTRISGHGRDDKRQCRRDDESQHVTSLGLWSFCQPLGRTSKTLLSRIKCFSG